MAIQKISFMRGSRWGRGPTPPPENSQVIWVSIENSVWIPQKAGPLENGVDPPGLMMELPLKPGKSNFLRDKTIDKHSDPLCKL